MAGEQFLGKLIGGAAGGAVGGPAGAQVGSQLGGAVAGSGDGQKSGQLQGLVSKFNGKGIGQLGQLAFGAGQSIMGAIKQKQAQAMTPPAESAMERQMLNTIRRRRRAIETGTANAAQNASARQLGKTMMTNSMRAGGQPNFGQYNQLIGNAMGNIAANTAQQLNPLIGMEQQQNTSMVNRATDLGLLRRSEMKADAARMQQAGAQNLLATLGAGKLEKENKAMSGQLSNQQNLINTLMAQLNALQSQSTTTTGS
jgi:hypothetical protein